MTDFMASSCLCGEAARSTTFGLGLIHTRIHGGLSAEIAPARQGEWNYETYRPARAMRGMLGNIAALAASPQELAARESHRDVLTKTSPIGQNVA